MKAIRTFFFILISFHQIKAQNKDSSINISYANVHEIFPKDQKRCRAAGESSGIFGFFSFYCGTIEEGIIYLWQTTKPYVRFNKKPPTRYLDYQSSAINPKQSREYIQSCVQYRFGFKVTNIQDTCEIWILETIDSAKLSKNLYHMVWGDSEDVEWGGTIDCFEGCGVPIQEFKKYVENRTGQMLMSKIDGNLLCNLSVPYSLFKNYSELDAYMRKNYGIGITKEKRLVDLKYVTFE